MKHPCQCGEGCIAEAFRLSRAEEEQERQAIPGYRARRWVVERSHSWMNRFRRLLTGWEKKPAIYLAFVHFACAWIAFHASGFFG